MADVAVSKVQKHIEKLQAKTSKQSEEIAKLKTQLKAAKSMSQRVRRVPKPVDDPAAPAQ